MLALLFRTDTSVLKNTPPWSMHAMHGAKKSMVQKYPDPKWDQMWWAQVPISLVFLTPIWSYCHVLTITAYKCEPQNVGVFFYRYWQLRFHLRFKVGQLHSHTTEERNAGESKLSANQYKSLASACFARWQPMIGKIWWYSWGGTVNRISIYNRYIFLPCVIIIPIVLSVYDCMWLIYISQPLDLYHLVCLIHVLAI